MTGSTKLYNFMDRMDAQVHGLHPPGGTTIYLSDIISVGDYSEYVVNGVTHENKLLIKAIVYYVTSILNSREMPILISRVFLGVGSYWVNQQYLSLPEVDDVVLLSIDYVCVEDHIRVPTKELTVEFFIQRNHFEIFNSPNLHFA